MLLALNRIRTTLISRKAHAHLGAVITGILVAGLLSLTAPPALGEMSQEELAKLTQNPIGNLISVPFQNNTNFDVGPQKGTQNILNIQPVIPVELNKDWNLITRTIMPIISQPPLAAGDDRVNGLGDIQFSAFLSPSDASSGVIWGVGAITQFPTHTDDALGNDNWGLGPAAVVLRLEKGSPWVYGVLVNNLWSIGGGASPSYNLGLIQPFVNYNFAGGTYLTSVPLITANWKADNSNRWTVPLGLGIGHIFHLGKLPVNTSLHAYYNVVKPDFAADWQLRLQVQLLFPK